MAGPVSFDGRLYRAALHLYPSRFRRDFSPEMICDFDDAREEARAAGGVGAMWSFRGRLLADFLRALVVQWIRTGWPFILTLSLIGSLATMSGLASIWPRAGFGQPADPTNEDLVILLLMTATLVVFLAANIIVTIWSTRFTRRRGRA
jgi:hypothetical protein